MKNLLFVLLYALRLPIAGHTQNQLTDMIGSATVLLKIGSGSGTGVLMHDSNFIYLITAGHMIINYDSLPRRVLNGSVGRIISYESPYSSKKDTLNLDFTILNKNGFIKVHPTQDVGIVIICKVNDLKTSSSSNKSIKYSYLKGVSKVNSSNISLAPVGSDLSVGFTNVSPGDDAILLGYPVSLQLYGNYDYDRMLLRKGIIAGYDGVNKTIIMDCPVYKGNSGGPVFQLSRDQNKTGIIGIVSRSILLEPLYYEKTIKYTNAGYTVIIPIEFALELINEH